MSSNSVEAYLRDVRKLAQYFEITNQKVGPLAVESTHLQGFLEWINTLGMTPHSQARTISGIRAFSRFRIMGPESGGEGKGCRSGGRRII